jgi:large subunit ribosomal protein L23
VNQERLMQVIVAPHVSEKGALVADKIGQHVFRVLPDANKGDVKKAVEKMFNVKVDSVRILNTKGKTKGFRGQAGRRQDWKKAYVRLAEGFDINFEGAEKA